MLITALLLYFKHRMRDSHLGTAESQSATPLSCWPSGVKMSDVENVLLTIIFLKQNKNKAFLKVFVLLFLGDTAVSITVIF